MDGGAWIGDIAHDLNPQILDDYFSLWRSIEAEGITFVDSNEDQIVWTLESSGKYTARSAYLIQFEGQQRSSFPNLIWKVWATPSCKFFLWLLLQDRLWTSQRLQLRGWPNNYFCASVSAISRRRYIYFLNAMLRVKSGRWWLPRVAARS